MVTSIPLNQLPAILWVALLRMTAHIAGLSKIIEPKLCDVDVRRGTRPTDVFTRLQTTINPPSLGYPHSGWC
jgi:hypothetical protein